MNSLVFTPDSMERFFRVLGSRVTIIETEEGTWPHKTTIPIKVIVKVPRKNYHFIRSTMAERMAFGTLWDVQLLGFWDNRINKYQFNWRKE